MNDITYQSMFPRNDELLRRFSKGIVEEKELYQAMENVNRAVELGMPLGEYLAWVTKIRYDAGKGLDKYIKDNPDSDTHWEEEIRDTLKEGRALKISQGCEEVIIPSIGGCRKQYNSITAPER